ncbi:unnamed protein product [Closterium sp. NIES-54]
MPFAIEIPRSLGNRCTVHGNPGLAAAAAPARAAPRAGAGDAADRADMMMDVIHHDRTFLCSRSSTQQDVAGCRRM